ncbi:MAG: hypothetical protein KGH79_02805 [Patescibacteria group bacterium]|nr:hypothetical protein [Patescibacteria group bacterium]
MYLTQHGEERIQGRTKMLTKDVLDIISNNAVVNLGSVGKYEYLLFYSPLDRISKIAVVAEDRQYLVSIWHRDYFLPAGVERPTDKHDKEARLALTKLLMSRVKIKPPGPKPLRLFEVKIEVEEDSEVVYEHDSGNIQAEDAELHSIWNLIKPQLASIASVITANQDKVRGRIRYWIILHESGTGKIIKRHLLAHWKVEQRLQTAY